MWSLPTENNGWEAGRHNVLLISDKEGEKVWETGEPSR